MIRARSSVVELAAHNGLVVGSNPAGRTNTRPHLSLTYHAIKRWQQRIEKVSEMEAVVAILAAIKSADPKYLTAEKIKRRTFRVPTERALLIGRQGVIVTILERGQSIFDRPSR